MYTQHFDIDKYRIPEFIHDKNLSWKAKALLAFLCSPPPEWDMRLQTISDYSVDGRTVVRNALEELKAAGYLKTQLMNSDKGPYVCKIDVYDERGNNDKKI